MNQPEKPDEDPLLSLLHSHLKQQEQALDVDLLENRIKNRITYIRNPNPEPHQQNTGRWRQNWATWTIGIGSFTLAASVLFLLVFAPSSELRAEQTIRQAEKALRLPVERCYLVEVHLLGGVMSEEILPARTLRVWATEDKFRVEMNRANFRLTWGRDSDGVVWLTANPQRGLRIAPEELGPGLTRMAEIYGLRTETLLSHILSACKLRQEARQGPNYPILIHAQPRAKNRQGWLRGAVIEIDAETKAIRKLTLRRANRSDDGYSIVNFTLIETRPVNHGQYCLEGNLTEPFQIYDWDFEPDRRREILSRWTDRRVDAWLKAKPKDMGTREK